MRGGPSRSRDIVTMRIRRSSGITCPCDLELTCSTGSITPTIVTDTSTDRSSSGSRSSRTKHDDDDDNDDDDDGGGDAD